MRSYIYYVGIHKLGNSRARQNKGNVDNDNIYIDMQTGINLEVLR